MDTLSNGQKQLEADTKCSLSTVMQLADSGFPTGGFSHSCGYEAAYSLGHVKNVKDMKNFLIGVLENTGSQSLPVLKAAYNCSDKTAEILKVDKFCDACLSNHVAKRASIQQGKSILSTSSQTFPQLKIKQLRLRTVVSSTVRLGNIGPLEAQRVQFEIQQLIPGIITRYIDTKLEDSCTTSPVVDLFQNCHDTLFSKMFIS